MKGARENPEDGPMQDRRVSGEAAPERPEKTPADADTPDQQGIEIDHAPDRPQKQRPH